MNRDELERHRTAAILSGTWNFGDGDRALYAETGRLPVREVPARLLALELQEKTADQAERTALGQVILANNATELAQARATLEALIQRRHARAAGTTRTPPRRA